MTARLFLPMAVSAGLLSACASTPPVSQRISEPLPGSVSYSYDPLTDTVTLKNGNTVLDTLPKTGTAGVTGSFDAYSNGATIVLLGRTGSGKGEAALIASVAMAHGMLGAVMSRDAAAQVPASGTASFAGDYAGFIIDKGLTNGSPINGAACLSADFGAGTIGGSIVNRNGYSFNNVTIPDLPIASGGSFSGAVSGGASTQPGSSTSNGQIMGMFADVGAGEIVGGMRMEHVLNGLDAIEVGAFFTSAGPCI